MGNFDSATLVSDDHLPLPAGQDEVAAASSGLSACTLYYVAVMAYDEEGNRTLSNVISVRTAGCPTPNPITNLSVPLAGKTTVSLEWREPSQVNGTADNAE